MMIIGSPTINFQRSQSANINNSYLSGNKAAVSIRDDDMSDYDDSPNIKMNLNPK